MKNPISEQIINHLEFLGYQIVEKRDEEEYDFLVATSDNKSIFIIQIYKDSLVYFLARYKFEAIKDIPDICKSINEVNLSSTVTKWCHSKNSEDQDVISIEGYFSGYDKVPFGAFIGTMEREIAKYIEKLKEEGETEIDNNDQRL